MKTESTSINSITEVVVVSEVRKSIIVNIPNSAVF
jgi:hypothetical protein